MCNGRRCSLDLRLRAVERINLRPWSRSRLRLRFRNNRSNRLWLRCWLGFWLWANGSNRFRLYFGFQFRFYFWLRLRGGNRLLIYYRWNGLFFLRFFGRLLRKLLPSLAHKLGILLVDATTELVELRLFIIFERIELRLLGLTKLLESIVLRHQWKGSQNQSNKRDSSLHIIRFKVLIGCKVTQKF